MRSESIFEHQSSRAVVTRSELDWWYSECSELIFDSDQYDVHWQAYRSSPVAVVLHVYVRSTIFLHVV
jgi:hypothetical protein